MAGADNPPEHFQAVNIQGFAPVLLSIEGHRLRDIYILHRPICFQLAWHHMLTNPFTLVCGRCSQSLLMSALMRAG